MTDNLTKDNDSLERKLAKEKSTSLCLIIGGTVLFYPVMQATEKFCNSFPSMENIPEAAIIGFYTYFSVKSLFYGLKGLQSVEISQYRYASKK